MKDDEKQPAVASPIEPVVMLQALTLDDVKGWEFCDTTPAHRKHYYSRELDVSAYISSGERKMQFYFNRRCETGNFAICFSDQVVVELAS
tara:strand:+ start:1353 stop:1622 length:270 start_codon:yes stop_codon:yes gene_type:complete